MSGLLWLWAVLMDVSRWMDARAGVWECGGKGRVHMRGTWMIHRVWNCDVVGTDCVCVYGWMGQ